MSFHSLESMKDTVTGMAETFQSSSVPNTSQMNALNSLSALHGYAKMQKTISRHNRHRFFSVHLVSYVTVL